MGEALRNLEELDSFGQIAAEGGQPEPIIGAKGAEDCNLDSHPKNDTSATGLKDPTTLSEVGHSAAAHTVRSPYSVSLEFFSGPMDLLLHLVHQREVPVEQVSMRDVAEQYLKVISITAFLDLEKASEYLVVAAHLLALKSRWVLPAEQNAQEEGLPTVDDESEEFLEELRRRLHLYEVTKARAQALIDQPQLGVDTFARVDRGNLQPTPEMLAEPEDVTGLGTIFARLLKRIGAGARSITIHLESVSVVSYMMKIIGGFSEKILSGVDADSIQESRFSKLLVKFGQEEKVKVGSLKGGSARAIAIGSFIAVLELMKRGLVRAQQEESGDVVITPRFSAADKIDRESLDSEFDAPNDSQSGDTGMVGIARGDQEQSGEQKSGRRKSRWERKVIPIEEYRKNEDQGRTEGV